MNPLDGLGRAQHLAAGGTVGARERIVRQLVELRRSMNREVKEHHERRLLGARQGAGKRLAQLAAPGRHGRTQLADTLQRFLATRDHRRALEGGIVLLDGGEQQWHEAIDAGVSHDDKLPHQLFVRMLASLPLGAQGRLLRLKGRSLRTRSDQLSSLGQLLELRFAALLRNFETRRRLLERLDLRHMHAEWNHVPRRHERIDERGNIVHWIGLPARPVCGCFRNVAVCDGLQSLLLRRAPALPEQSHLLEEQLIAPLGGAVLLMLRGATLLLQRTALLLQRVLLLLHVMLHGAALLLQRTTLLLQRTLPLLQCSALSLQGL